MIKKETYRVDVVSTRDYSVDFEKLLPIFICTL